MSFLASTIHLRDMQIANLSKELIGFDVISISPGIFGEMYLLAVSSPKDYRVQVGIGVFTKIQTEQAHDFLIIKVDDNKIEKYHIQDQTWNYHHVQPLKGNKLLLVCSRSAYRGADDYDLNGKVFNQDGDLHREFLLGDGIQDVQTTADDLIWVSYFDEGIFGNFGWTRPIGIPGLIKFDQSGNRVYEFEPSDGLDSMADCYALNVTLSDETWCYYYVDFPLVRIRNHAIDGVWKSPIRSANSFALWGDLVLFIGGYFSRHKPVLVQLQAEGRVKKLIKYNFRVRFGSSFKPEFVKCRGPYVFLFDEGNAYRVDIRELQS